jgi:hypothetical protein
MRVKIYHFELARVLVRFDHVAQIHRKRDARLDVTGCRTSRNRLHC